MATAKQIKARELFAKRAKAGAFARKGAKRKTRRSNPATPDYDDNPTGTGNIILDQLGGHRFIAMTGAKNFVGNNEGLSFVIPRNKSGANRCTVKLVPGDLYRIWFIKYSPRTGAEKTIADFEDVYADQLRQIFTDVTGLYTSLGTMGRERNPRARTPAPTRYANKTDAELEYIIKDAGEAARAMRGHAPEAEAKYLDQVNDAVTERYRRLHSPARKNPRALKPVAPGIERVRNMEAIADAAGPDTVRAWNDHYIVQFRNPGEREWTTQSAFKTLNDAAMYAKSLARNHPKWQIRVIDAD